ncbi:MAG: hypothetical protein K6L74_16325 [Neptuniibacter sp.]
MHDLKLSVIIPVGPDEKEVPSGLLQDLQKLPENSEVIFVGCDQDSQSQFMEKLPAEFLQCYAAPGRAQQMNLGAEVAKGRFLWFLHLDSRFNLSLLTNLIENLDKYPERLHYNLLQFVSAGRSPMGLNAHGANLRSRVLGVPFGDQGFAMKRELFFKVGQYPVSAPYGEDHLFVWHARQYGSKLCCNPHKLKTSARKYRQQGWIQLTLKYQYLWLRQALPEALKLIKIRYFSPRCQR